jgi:threonine synthase
MTLPMRRVAGWPGIIEAYRSRFELPASGHAPVTLLEGNTPLIAAPRLAQALRIRGDLFLKYEGLNPTGSFKDRGMTVAMTAAVAEGSRAVICASTGNTSASAAAYAARAGLRALVIIPRGKIALGKLSQAVVAGATVVEIDGNFDQALRIVRELATQCPVTVVNSINPYRLLGQRSAAFEICDALERAPDLHILPVGNAGNITAYWAGYKQYRADGVIERAPKMMGFQAEGAAPIVLGRPVDHPETVATAIRIGNPASWDGAVQARDESGGAIDAVSDAEILDAYGLLARTEGVFAEPASAASIAGAKRLASQGAIPQDAVVVCTLTGHGLKDPTTATESCPPPVRAAASVDAVRAALDL